MLEGCCTKEEASLPVLVARALMPSPLAPAVYLLRGAGERTHGEALPQAHTQRRKPLCGLAAPLEC